MLTRLKLTQHPHHLLITDPFSFCAPCDGYFALSAADMPQRYIHSCLGDNMHEMMTIATNGSMEFNGKDRETAEKKTMDDAQRAHHEVVGDLFAANAQNVRTRHSAQSSLLLSTTSAVKGETSIVHINDKGVNAIMERYTTECNAIMAAIQ